MHASASAVGVPNELRVDEEFVPVEEGGYRRAARLQATYRQNGKVSCQVKGSFIAARKGPRSKHTEHQRRAQMRAVDDEATVKVFVRSIRRGRGARFTIIWSIARRRGGNKRKF